MPTLCQRSPWNRRRTTGPTPRPTSRKNPRNDDRHPATMNDDPTALDDFTGTARLFPLPSLGLPPQGPARTHLEKLLQSELPLGVYCDLLAFAAPLPVEAKQRLLEVLEPEQRARDLLGLLTAGTGVTPAGATATVRKFPPDFSS